MSKSKGALTNAQVEKFKGGAVYAGGNNKGKQKPQDFLWCSELPGFGIRLGMKTGVKTFILQYRLRGVATDKIISIGRYGEPLLIEGRVFSLEVNLARQKALELKAKMRLGIDPVAQEKEQREAATQQAEVGKARTTTLREVLEHFLAHHRTKHGPLRPRTAADYRTYMERHLTTWLDRPVCEITRAACLERFTEVSSEAPVSANLTFEYLRALLNHAREMFTTEDGDPTILAANPVSRMFKIRRKNPEKARDRRIPLTKIGAVWLELQKRRTAARTIDQRTATDWVCTMLLTGMRLTESASLKWTDIDLEAKTLTLRSNVVKNHNEVTLPMSTLLHEILSERRAPAPEPEKVTRRRRPELKRSSEYVFATNGQKTPHITGAPGTFDAIKKASGVQVSAHDLRRTFEDLCVAVKVDSDQRRLLLNHISGDVHAVHYSNNRNALQAAVEAVATYVTNAAKIAAAGNVVSLPLPAQRAAG